MANTPTVRELARMLGVSRTTVSMALRNHPKVSDKTRKRVHDLAKKTGYRPDPLASTLMNRLRISRKKRSTEKLAYLTSWTGGAYEWRINANEIQYYEGAARRAQDLGYEVEHFWAKEPGISSRRMSTILYSRGIRGIVFAPLPKHLGHVSLAWKHFACAAIGLTILKPGLHRATHDYHKGMILALRMLKRKGYRRIGFANSTLFDQRVNHGWLSGFLTFQHYLPAEERVPPLLVDHWEESEFAARLKRGDKIKQFPEGWREEQYEAWLKEHRPDAVVSNTEHPLVFARQLGLRVPEDLGYAQLHRIRENDPWAGIDRLPRTIGAAAVDLVVGQLQNNECGLPRNPKCVVVEGVWREGPSVSNRLSVRRVR